MCSQQSNWPWIDHWPWPSPSPWGRNSSCRHRYLLESKRGEKFPTHCGFLQSQLRILINIACKCRYYLHILYVCTVSIYIYIHTYQHYKLIKYTTRYSNDIDTDATLCIYIEHNYTFKISTLEQPNCVIQACIFQRDTAPLKAWPGLSVCSVREKFKPRPGSRQWSW